MSEEREVQQIPESEARSVSDIPEVTPIPEVTQRTESTVPEADQAEEPQTIEETPEVQAAETQQPHAPAAEQPTAKPQEYPNPFAPPAPPPQYVPQSQPTYQPPQYAPQGQPAYQPPQYAPQGQPTYQPPQYVPQGQPTYRPPQPNYAGGYVPPQPPYDANNTQTPKGSRNAGQVLMWVAAILIEAVIVGFAIYGIFALCTRGTQQPDGPSYSQGSGQQMPSRPNKGDNDGNGSASSGSSSIRENSSNVQMGLICFEMPDQYVEYYKIEKGLVVQSFASDSPALETDLKEGDVITAMNGVRITSFDELDAVMKDLEPGDEVTLTCYRMLSSNDTYKPSDPFEVTFKVQEKHDAVSSYPGA